MSTVTKKLKPRIIGIKADNKLVYVGKTHKTNNKGEVIKSNIGSIYQNSKLNKLVVGKDKNVEVVDLQNTNFLTWYYDRNKQAHEQYKNGEVNLVNDPFILEGKNGFWEGKKRDKHTLKRLSESKHKRVVCYKKNGEIKKIYSSAKDIAKNVIGDYKVENGSGCSKIYTMMQHKTIKHRKYNDNYFFYEKELKEHFSCIPKKLNISALLANDEKEKAEKKRFFKKRTTVTRYKVQQYNLDAELLHEFTCAKQASDFHELHETTINKACRENHNRLLDSIWVYGYKHEIKCDDEGKPIIEVYKGS